MSKTRERLPNIASARVLHALHAEVRVTMTDTEIAAVAEIVRSRNTVIAAAMGVEEASKTSLGAITNAILDRMTFDNKLRLRRAVEDGTYMDETKWASFGTVVELAE